MSVSGVNWLDDEQQEAWRHYIRGSRALETALDSELQNAAGMSLSEYELLSMLSEAPDRVLRMSALADLIVQSRSRVTHTANRLARRGWVERRAAVGDGRGVELMLTESGMDAVLQAAQSHVTSVRQHLVDVIDKDALIELGRTMSKVCERL
ncbi:MarR family winged helix-turn-helix transcriptional regulator [Yimella sp. cx-51]|uniref:MarR family winged helix-turn-helix transcriptional regulator n=1 Tax=Yimella sp. cx-51 TaxID=2770551 RepID=UPI00165E7CEF|nr:MarR family transcriptional regulator [Yimella sp. cx-51]MBC9956329.1 MarR family transcriptional regulator [Yimella sp. cx-51]QTH38541.1 MarR family transcriptional regulator [Yimella sp. cx-51]